MTGPKAQKFLDSVNSPWKMRLYFLGRLPSMIWWGVKVKEVTSEECTVMLPYNWRSKNPFRSTYFAAQCAVAELSTGMLAQLALQDQPSVSMLVTEIKSVFTKKATARAYFTCKQGQLVAETVQKAVDTGKPQIITMKSVGRMADGTVVSETELTWSFKLRSKK
ncbi:MAG: DUF4442 domain-containing protein [Bacteroidetes bacterium]|nr:DUF4442 domain-containing protein [Bacteroidota bacterium]